MKGIIATLGLAGSLLLLSGCGGGHLGGAIYSDYTAPTTATSSSNASKEGQAVCTSILGLVAIGDCSIDTAAKNGSVSTIKSVDSKVWSILGIYTTVTTIVKGN